MSGCHNPSTSSETMSVCTHGKPVKFPCALCASTHSEFTLIDILKSIQKLRNRIDSLHEHKIRQIDENRKTSKLVNAHEEYLKNIDKIALCDPEKVYNNHKKLNEWVEKLNSEMNVLLSRIIQVEEMQKSMISMPNVIWQKYNKVPYKCPVCDGKEPSCFNHSYMQAHIHIKECFCHVCEGKGIVWG